MLDRRLLQICPESKRFIAGNIFFQWLELILSAGLYWLIASTIQYFYLKSSSVFAVETAVGAMLFLIFLRVVMRKAAAKMSYLASRNIKKVLRCKIYAKLLQLGSTWRETTSAAELVQAGVEGVEQLESYFGLYVPQLFYAFVAPLTMAAFFAGCGGLKIGAVLLACVPLIPVAIIAVQKFAKRLLRKYWGQYTQLGSSFLENLQGLTTLKTYMADAKKNEEMNIEAERFRKVTMAVLSMQLNSLVIMDLVSYGGAVLGIILTVQAFRSNTISLAACIFMLLLSAEFFLPMRSLGSFFHVAMNGMAAGEKILKFLDTPNPPPKQLSLVGGKIVLHNVSFSYVEGREALKKVNITIPSPSFIGIVGKSGSGKSTLAYLLNGRNCPDSGEITIGGRSITEISVAALKQVVTYLGAASVLFKGTVRENLALAMTEPNEQRMWEVLEDCRLAGFLKNEEGLETKLTENAGNLSGGQRQRLALARAILHDSSIYLFDEATGNIDSESENAILAEIRRLSKSKTVIMITHRLANVAEADCIYCLENGKVKEQGKHDELIRLNGCYAALWKTQVELENYARRSDNEK